MTIREPKPPEGAENRKSLRVLYVEDSPTDAELSLRELKKAGFDVDADIVQTPEEFAECLRSKTYDIVLSDQNLPGWTGMAALESLVQQKKDIPFILVTGSLGEEAAVECIKKGASD
ncbi:MAG: response regulator, partial [Terriglobia bacterium]